MKTATRQYAKRQVQWIRNKLLPETNAANTISQTENGADVTPTYLLDATGECLFLSVSMLALILGLELGDAWVNGVQGAAERITQSKE